MAQVNMGYVSPCGSHILNADSLGVQGHVQDSKAVLSEMIGHTTVYKRLHQPLVFSNLTSSGIREAGAFKNRTSESCVLRSMSRARWSGAKTGSMDVCGPRVTLRRSNGMQHGVLR